MEVEDPIRPSVRAILARGAAARRKAAVTAVLDFYTKRPDPKPVVLSQVGFDALERVVVFRGSGVIKNRYRGLRDGHVHRALRSLVDLGLVEVVPDGPFVDCVATPMGLTALFNHHRATAAGTH